MPWATETEQRAACMAGTNPPERAYNRDPAGLKAAGNSDIKISVNRP